MRAYHAGFVGVLGWLGPSFWVEAILTSPEPNRRMLASAARKRVDGNVRGVQRVQTSKVIRVSLIIHGCCKMKEVGPTSHS